jgi:two-component system, response regulator PdtaR
MRIKVLIAEDERIIAMDISNQLQMMNYEVTSVVSSGEDAIRECRSKKPHIVLMDVGLNGVLSGTEAASTIYHEFHIPIIHLTGAKKKLLETELNYPMICLDKPFEGHTLKKIIDTVLSY